ncbi:OsmC family protein [uncultured Paracoccus sp.]|uniref:OsmC family protein n=1 Tax=uncultured Paracoccus sp. TaxID=189685 RepID=UPI0026030DBD|nr:OsmC family protein [uncultured Paracoccus sp.]
MNEHAASLRERQDPLRKRYRDAPDEARITDHAIASSPGADPFHGSVAAGEGAPFAFGIHRAVGGDHDLPNPGDLLCAALAACLDSTLRMIAARMAVNLETLEVTATAFADVRGCLMVDPSIPAGFERIELEVRFGAGTGTDPAQLEALTANAERCCVVLQTLRAGIPITTKFSAPALDARDG